MRPRSLLIAAVAAFCLDVNCAVAQTNPVAETAGYQGADRQQRLAEGAKREKELTLYSSIPPADIAALVAAFDKKYAIKVKVWRSDSEGFLQRVLSEARARRFDVDIVAGASSALEPLYRENLLQEVKSPYLADVVPEAIPAHRQWVAMYFTLFVQAYNTDIVRKDSLPNSSTGSCSRSGGGSSASRLTISIGLPKWSRILANNAGCSSSAISWPRMASLCARGTA